MEKLLNVAQVAEYLQMDDKTILKWIRAGEMPAIYVGKSYRVREDDLAAWLESHRGRNPNKVGRGRGGNFRGARAKSEVGAA